MRRAWESKGLGYYLLKYGFPLVYALTVMPFTVSFFRRFASIRSDQYTDLQLFNLAPLPQVHEYFLPLFILSLELISIQLAVGFWASRKLARTLLALLSN